MNTRIFINSETGHIDVDDEFAAVLAEYSSPMAWLFLNDNTVAVKKSEIRGIMKL
jgi:hypothetical protein